MISLLSQVKDDTSRTPSGQGTSPLHTVLRQPFTSMAIILPRPFAHLLIPLSRDRNMVFWRKKATLRFLQYLR